MRVLGTFAAQINIKLLQCSGGEGERFKLRERKRLCTPDISPLLALKKSAHRRTDLIDETSLILTSPCGSTPCRGSESFCQIVSRKNADLFCFALFSFALGTGRTECCQCVFAFLGKMGPSELYVRGSQLKSQYDPDRMTYMLSGSGVIPMERMFYAGPYHEAPMFTILPRCSDPQRTTGILGPAA